VHLCVTKIVAQRNTGAIGRGTLRFETDIIPIIIMPLEKLIFVPD
jgi:hypothetical protein